MEDDGHIISVRGTRTLLHLPPSNWDRRRTTYPIACPDGVTRCIAFPNWWWRLWVPDFDPDAFATGSFAPFVADAWQFAQVLAPIFDASSVMAERLAYQINLDHRQPYYRPANNNPPPDFWDAWLRVPRPPGWRRGGLSGFFCAAARVPPLTPGEAALLKFYAAHPSIWPPPGGSAENLLRFFAAYPSLRQGMLRQ